MTPSAVAAASASGAPPSRSIGTGITSRVVEGEEAPRSESEASAGESPADALRGTWLGVDDGAGGGAASGGIGVSIGGRDVPGSVRSIVSARVRLEGRITGAGPPAKAPCVCSSQVRSSSSSGASELALRSSGRADR